MYSEQMSESLSFQLSNIALLRFGTDSDYEDIISPFTRIYLVNEGRGWIAIGKEKIILEPGNLYLIPGYTSCTYHFGKGLNHYYIHLNIDQPNGLNPYSIYAINHKIEANELDIHLFKRILQINPDMELPHHHPHVYQTKPWLNKKVSFQTSGQHLETIGILMQLFSRFLDLGNSRTLARILKYNFQPILMHIQMNLSRNMRVDELANIACLSKDHFSKVFKSVTGMTPSDFIIRKRIERAQFLLLTTDLRHKEIIEKTGFKSASYFSRIFKRHTSYSPERYRKQRG